MGATGTFGDTQHPPNQYEANVIYGVNAGALGGGTSKRTTVTAGVAVVTITPATGVWSYLQVFNLHATAVLSVNINADPTASSGSLPGIVWGSGQDVGPASSALIPLTGTLTDIRVLSDTASTPVVLNLVA